MHKISGKTYKRIMFAISMLAWMMLANEALLIHMKDRSQKEMKQEENIQEKGQQNKQQNIQNNIQNSIQNNIQKNRQESTIQKSSKEGMEKESLDPKIRVLLMDSDYDTYQHPEIIMQIHGEMHTYTAKDLEDTEEKIRLDGGSEGIKVTSIKRNNGNPTYMGILEIKKTKNEEGLYLINELPLETYLQGVVPSEMPSSYHQQALMAQAVCARTYAWKQMEEGGLEEYGADVDDSVNFQVYQNQALAETTSRAVEDTKGQVMTQNGELIQAYYFSTSAGTTSTDQIWGADQPAPYLKSVVCSFDEDQPWGSWIVEIPWEQISRSTALYNQGKLLGLQITRKSESGAVTGLTVNTELGSFMVEGEYNVRQFLAPTGCEIKEQDGSTAAGGALLPSAYFTLEQELESRIRIQGRGYGHGVGMSQSAANQMAEEGYSWKEILEYFFKDIQITSR